MFAGNSLIYEGYEFNTHSQTEIISVKEADVNERD
jgi:hypothetical protein